MSTSPRKQKISDITDGEAEGEAYQRHNQDQDQERNPEGNYDTRDERDERDKHEWCRRLIAKELRQLHMLSQEMQAQAVEATESSAADTLHQRTQDPEELSHLKLPERREGSYLAFLKRVLFENCLTKLAQEKPQCSREDLKKLLRYFFRSPG